MAEEHNLKVAVDRGTCIGNGVCVALAPRAFSLDESMKAVVTDSAAESYENLLAAAESCPVQAIYLSADDYPIYP
ncbi:MAG: ferredoxin [Chloroflexota bacterium]|nr:ferredoxin [Chloroflexota bacterium]